MKAGVQVRKLELCGPQAICARLQIRNESGETWPSAAGFALGYQIYDPESDILLLEGERVPFDGDVEPGASRDVEITIDLPPETAAYRVLVSPVQEGVAWSFDSGGQFLLIDALVADGAAAICRAKAMTRRTLGFELFFRSVQRAFKYPVLSIYRNRSLIRSMVRRDIMGRYRGSFGGLYWTVLNPVLLMLTYFFVFGVVLPTRFPGDPSRTGYVLYFLAGMLPWLAFSEAAGRAPFVILEHRNFVKKLIFPVDTLPVNLVIAGLITEAFAAALFTIGVVIARGAFPLTVLWLPVLLVPQVLFTMGLCWFLSAFSVYVRDLGQVNGFLLTLWFFMTPICYPMEQWPRQAAWILSKNPLYVLVRGYRAIFLEGQAPPFAPTAKLWVLSLLAFLLGYAWFYKLRKDFADVI